MLYGDTATVLGNGSDVSELTKEQWDTSGQYGMRIYNIGEDPTDNSLHSKGML